MKTKESSGVTVEPAGFEDYSEEKQRLLDVPPRISSVENEPWWITALGVTAFGVLVYVLLVLF